jgi:hypothetical protein
MTSSPFISRNANSEWAPIIKAQVEVTRAAELEDRKARDLSKKLYAEELERQLAYKRQRQHDDAELKRREVEVMRQRQQAIVDFDRRVRADKSLVQQSMAQQYDMDQHLKSMRIEADRRDWLNIEQQRLQEIQGQVQQEILRKRQYKDSIVRAEQEELSVKLMMKQQQALEREQDKLNEQARIKEEQGRLADRDRQRTEYIKGLNSKIDTRSRAYNSVSQADLDRDMEKAYLVQQWENSAKQQQEQTTQQQSFKKQAAQQATNDILNMQLQFKQTQQQRAQQQHEMEKLEVRERAEQIRLANAQIKQQTYQDQGRLKASLESQINEQNLRRLDDLKMSERERQLHMGFIQRQEVPTFTSVPGVHPREIPLKKVLPRFAKSSSADFTSEAVAYDAHGGESEYSSSQIYKQQMSPLEYNYDPRRHDPIVNPIGSVIPRPLPGQSLRKGRGLTTLGAAGTATLNR